MIGTVVSGYRIDGKLGEGGMGEVYAATHELMGKRVAIKVLRYEHSQNADVVARFFKEARAAMLLNHPGCVDIIDTGRLDDGRGYIVMALLEGQSLKDRIAQGQMPAATVVAIARQVADVLHTAHAKGIIHRDLKPENVFVAPDEADPSGVRVKVLDFGVAKLSEGGVVMTNPNAIIGTPAYMSPEQCKGARFVDTQSDIYSLGCMMYEMVAGRTPFVCRGFGDYLIAHLSAPVPAPSTLAPVDARLERVIMRALAKEKPERQASMAAVIAELDALNLPHAASQATTVMGSKLTPEQLGELRALSKQSRAASGAGTSAARRGGGGGGGGGSNTVLLVVIVIVVAAVVAGGATLLLLR
jgi:eukaryotic-like serine/threonine-protein kinase